MSRANTISAEKKQINSQPPRKRNIKLLNKPGSLTMKSRPLEYRKVKKLPDEAIMGDEHPRASCTVDALQKLKPLNEKGVVTATKHLYLRLLI